MGKLCPTSPFCFPWLWFLLDAIFLGEPFAFAAGKCLCSEFIETGSRRPRYRPRVTKTWKEHWGMMYTNTNFVD